MMERKTQITYIVVGDYATGKTSLLDHFFCDGQRDHDQSNAPLPTMGVDYRIKVVLTQRYGKVEFLLRDTSGMEQYNSQSLTQTFYRGAEGVLLVFDVTRRQTFEHVVTVWMPRLRAVNTMHQRCRYMLVGNKTDLADRRQVSQEEARMLAHEYNMDYIELSSLTATCDMIREPFMIMAAHLISDRVCVCREYPLPGQHSSGTGLDIGSECCSGSS